MCKHATCQLVKVHSISPCLPFRGKASKLPVNKDTSKVQRTRGENKTPTCKPFAVDIKHKVSFSNTHFIHILWRRSSAPGRLHTALTSNVSPRVETRGGGQFESKHLIGSTRWPMRGGRRHSRALPCAVWQMIGRRPVAKLPGEGFMGVEFSSRVGCCGG